MISCDTNILFPAFDTSSALHARAREFLEAHASSDVFCLCEQVLMELYCLLRNPAVCGKPLEPAHAVTLIQGLRSNPCWKIVDVMQDSSLMDNVWSGASKRNFPHRRIFDLRLAATLRQHQVTDFATRNRKDFQQLGFSRVWDPLEPVKDA